MYNPVMFDFTTDDRYWIEQENDSPVQFKWILAADLGFFGNVSTPVVFEMHRSRRAWALLRQVKTNSPFLAGCLSQIEMGLSTFIKFPPHSK